MKYLPNDLINKFILNKYFSIFDETDEDLINLLMEKLCDVIILNEKNKNEEFFKLLKNKIQVLFSWITVI